MGGGHSGDGKITPEMLARERGRIGNPIKGKPWAALASADTIRHAALAVGDDNPLYLDRDYASASRFGALIAPPMFPYAATSLSASVGGIGFPGIFTLHAEDVWDFHAPVKEGDLLDATIMLKSIEERPSKWGGTSVHQVTEFKFTNQRGEVPAVYTPLYVRAERGKARANKKYDGFTAWQYSNAELAEISDGYAREVRRGATPRYWDDVNVGDDVGHVVKGPLTVTDMICWWMGMGAPYLFAFGIREKRLKERPGLAIIDPDTNIRHTPEIAHFDEKYAVRSGVGAAYDIGRQRTAWFLHLLTNWAGDAGWVTTIRARFERPNHVGDTTWCRGRVIEKKLEGDAGLVKVEMEARTQRDVVHATGQAWVRLPRK